MREEIIRMAREAWKGRGSVDAWFEECAPNFERFAELVAAAKKEECAKVCDNMAELVDEENTPIASDQSRLIDDCAAAIRAL